MAQYDYVEYATSERRVKDLVFTQVRGMGFLRSSHSENSRKFGCRGSEKFAK
jgi:hypothetical protein